MFLRERWRRWWSGAFWVIPASGVVAGLLVEDGINRLDVLTGDLSPSLSPSSAQTMLAAVGGGMVTFTGFVFSVVLLMLQFGSATYSPRTVTHVLQARTAQVVLAVFLGTIVFSFRALITIGSGGRQDFVPLFSVVVALVALVLSLFGFLALVQAVGRTLKVDSLLSSIGRSARRAVRGRSSVAGDDRTVVPDAVPTLGDGPGGAPGDVVRHAGPPGYVVAVDVRHLSALTDVPGPGLRLTLLVGIGDAVSEGSAVARWDGRAVDPRAVRRGLLVRPERLLALDPLYGTRLLVDIALRALSPAVNDPTTAARAIGEIDGVLRAAAPLSLGPRVIQRGDGRLVVPAATWDDLVDLALLEILRAGMDSPQTTRRLSTLIRLLLEDLPLHRHPALLRYQRLLVDQISRRVAAEERPLWMAIDRQGIGGAR